MTNKPALGSDSEDSEQNVYIINLKGSIEKCDAYQYDIRNNS